MMGHYSQLYLIEYLRQKQGRMILLWSYEAKVYELVTLAAILFSNNVLMVIFIGRYG